MADGQSDAVIASDYGASNVPKGMAISVVGKYTVPASGGPVSGDKVEMVNVPAGAQVVDIKVRASGGTTALTVAVGDDVDPDRYIAATANTAAALVNLAVNGNAAAPGLGFEYTADDTIDITFAGATPTATHEYTMVATYVTA